MTWNMSRGFARGRAEDAWALVGRQQPAFALLQETSPPLQGEGHLVYEGLRPARGRPWGTAIWSPVTQLRRLPGPGSHPGACAVAEVDADAGPVTLISIYGLLETINGTQYSITTLHRLLSDLTVFLEDPKRRGRIILGGDLNANIMWDQSDRQGTPTHRLFFDRLEAFGLKSVLPYRDPAEQTATWHPTKPRVITQLDHLFVSDEIEVGSGGWVAYDDEVAAVSDHAPVWVELLALDWGIRGPWMTSLADRMADADGEVIGPDDPRHAELEARWRRQQVAAAETAKPRPQAVDRARQTPPATP